LAIFSPFRQRSQSSIIIGFEGLSHETKPLIKVCSCLPQSINSTMAYWKIAWIWEYFCNCPRRTDIHFL